MMRELVVRADGIGKQYSLGEMRASYGLLSEALGARLRGRGKQPPRRSDFWALREVSFEVPQGQTFGIIGHNGAGKSTLLKIIARVTPPTTGEMHLRGRVGTLLEVGTGFHPELTGRENIYLNGAVLGMQRSEIARKFDEIVSFAEVEKFIDTPVKRYSSGMYLRLAFAVAAHLEPEILIVDEVLAVGDLAFQKKCLGRMDAVASEGRTVLFVSHNLAAVSTLCERAMLLSRGTKMTEGPASDVIESYVRSLRRETGVGLRERTDRQGTGAFRFTEAALVTDDGVVIDSPASGQDFSFALQYETVGNKPLHNVSVAIGVMTVLGQLILHLYSRTAGVMFREVPGRGEIRCRVPRCPLPAGQYGVTLWAELGGEPLDWVDRAFELTVHEGDFYGSGQPQLASHPAVLVDHEWSIATTPEDIGAAPSMGRKQAATASFRDFGGSPREP